MGVGRENNITYPSTYRKKKSPQKETNQYEHKKIRYLFPNPDNFEIC